LGWSQNGKARSSRETIVHKFIVDKRAKGSPLAIEDDPCRGMVPIRDTRTSLLLGFLVEV